MALRAVNGQQLPAATTLTALYTVPEFQTPAQQHPVRDVCVVACNRAGTATTIRISYAPLGAVDATNQYLVYDATLLANETKVFDFGFALAYTDVIRVWSASGSVAFNFFGTTDP